MFRQIKRTKQSLSKEKCLEIINENTGGVLSVSGDNGYPYGVPMSYVYDNNKIYFHCGQNGHKIDGIKRNNKVCFTVIGADKIVPEEFNTYYSSVIIFGKANIVEDLDLKRKALVLLSDKYSPDFKEESTAEINKFFDTVCIIELEIEDMQGKVSLELVEK